MYACNGILFNHESPRRGETFVTRKITRGLARIDAGLDQCLYMGNLDSLRDWGHARDYVEMQWLMLQQEKPEDFVIATGITTSVREFVRMAFLEAGIEVSFTGKGADEKGIISAIHNDAYTHLKIGQEVVAVDANYFRPTEVDLLIGDPSKSNQVLGWKPKYDLPALVKEMVAADLALFQKEKMLEEAGFQIKKELE
jgi:GDPmannose 4,6-dehydratase